LTDSAHAEDLALTGDAGSSTPARRSCRTRQGSRRERRRLRQRAKAFLTGWWSSRHSFRITMVASRSA
jgi:hypothetical protein